MTVKQVKEALQKHSAIAELAERVRFWLRETARVSGAASFKKFGGYITCGAARFERFG